MHDNESCLVPEIIQDMTRRQVLAGAAEEGGPGWQNALDLFHHLGIFLRKLIQHRQTLGQKGKEGTCGHYFSHHCDSRIDRSVLQRADSWFQRGQPIMVGKAYRATLR